MIAFPKHKLKQLHKELWGNMADISKRYGHPYSSLNSVLKGHYYNQQIIDDCIEYRNELIDSMNKLAEKI